ncbi:MAG: isocitrate/isopropylmalate dehydrogenase family protein [Acetobacteraceae bacterium]
MLRTNAAVPGWICPRGEADDPLSDRFLRSLCAAPSSPVAVNDLTPKSCTRLDASLGAVQWRAVPVGVPAELHRAAETWHISCLSDSVRRLLVRIVMMPGDGIGPEVSAATARVLKAVDSNLTLGISLETHEIGLGCLAREGTTLPLGVLEAARKADGVILGPVSTLDYPPQAEGGVNVSAALRKELDLYANIRPARSHAGLPHYARTPIDLVIVRENTEGFYAVRTMHEGGGEFMPTPELALAIRKISATSSRRIARTAFALAEGRRRRVTAVHKANVLKMTDGLFLSEVRKVAAEFPAITYEEQLVDSMAAMLVRNAERFDVVVTSNMFGDILSDEATELSGSIGLGAAINAGEEHCMAQAQHGSAPDIAGKDLANPVSLIRSAAMLLAWLARRRGVEKLARAASMIEGALDRMIADPTTRTRDLGGDLGTAAFTAVLLGELDGSVTEGG